MSHTVYGDSVKVYDITFTTNGSGVATESLHFDGQVVDAVVKMDVATDFCGYISFIDADSITTPINAPSTLSRRPVALYGNYTLTISDAAASASGRLKLFVR